MAGRFENHMDWVPTVTKIPMTTVSVDMQMIKEPSKLADDGVQCKSGNGSVSGQTT
jgi:hypothetical protein